LKSKLRLSQLYKTKSNDVKKNTVSFPVTCISPLGRELDGSGYKWMFGNEERCRGKTEMDDGKADKSKLLHWNSVGV
ncbi:MAG: hypothetical protein ACKVI1_09740, partial [Flavobacteriales bacterium]